ncbi:MAG TPA: cohesin domain-containing protein [Candidatus Bathyarchaeia archaeon]|nr:cohesin domain-containing protein [Candidatus Bathyarchaeia archaeon]
MMRALTAIVAAFLVLAQGAGAATVALEDKDVEVGIPTAVSLGMSLINGPGDTVAGAQVDVVFDSDVMTLVGITAGAAATSAGKSVSYSELEPGVIRLMVMGMNINTIGDGDLARLSFVLGCRMPSGDYTIDLDGLVLSNPVGMAVASVADPSVLSVTALPLPAVQALWLAGLVLMVVAARSVARARCGTCLSNDS